MSYEHISNAAFLAKILSTKTNRVHHVTTIPRAEASPDTATLRLERKRRAYLRARSRICAHVGGLMPDQTFDDELRRKFSDLGFVTVSNNLIPVLRMAEKAISR
jgi:hypothetical protein